MSLYNKINITDKCILQSSCIRRVNVGFGLTTLQLIQDLEIAEIGD